MSSTKLVIQQNNELREELTEENKVYYEELLVYVRTKSWFKDERKIEEVLLEVLQDLIVAQEEGVMAEDYFGRDPETSANNIVNNIDYNLIGGLKILLQVFGISSIFSLLNMIVSAETSINLTSILFRTGYLYLAVFIFLQLLKNESFHRSSSKLKESLYIISLITIIVSGPLIEATLLPNFLNFSLPLFIPFGLYFFAVSSFTWKFFKMSAEERKIWVLLLILAWGALIFGIINTL
ncbi:hypothetical protein ACFP65_00815 [Marinilactibacillus sp. GCM10026970]|uniref:hypothetical protein n=1 Tax=Marinilactibacillus sp. GCM10026970 TaxID=3252642 RepID=UPI00362232AE